SWQWTSFENMAKKYLPPAKIKVLRFISAFMLNTSGTFLFYSGQHLFTSLNHFPIFLFSLHILFRLWTKRPVAYIQLKNNPFQNSV
ncbi:hypothetical protein, partial [Akkermansia sp.]